MMTILRTSSLGSNVTGSYKKKECRCFQATNKKMVT